MHIIYATMQNGRTIKEYMLAAAPHSALARELAECYRRVYNTTGIYISTKLYSVNFLLKNHYKDAGPTEFVRDFKRNNYSHVLDAERELAEGVYRVKL